jgi:monoamine oxidase
MNTVDVIIIGSGIAGLYAAYQIKRLAPANTTFLILEKNPKKWMGGRAGNEMFYGADVVVGAGVGRKKKDHALIKLLKDTKTHYSEFESTRNYASFTPVDITAESNSDSGLLLE